MNLKQGRPGRTGLGRVGPAQQFKFSEELVKKDRLFHLKPSVLAEKTPS
jgi:hypothetical protein